MEAAKAFVANHTARTGHTTEVEEDVRPAVIWEQIHPTRHEIVTEALDKEVHQHHYHTTVQPLSHTVILPEKHTHNLVSMRKVHHQKDDIEVTKQRLASEAARFRHSSVIRPITHSRKQMPTVIGTHYHHHVHEMVQPVIYKETIVPEFIHTTIPIHEHHHMKAEHHTMSALPMKSMADFEAMKFSPRGTQKYEGVPRPYEGHLETTFDELASGVMRPSRGSHNHNKLAVNTTPRRRSASISSQSSGSSASSLSSMEQPMTPRSPRHSKHTPQFNTFPTKDMNANRPVKIVDENSPRMSNESSASGRTRFMDKLAGRV